MAFAESLPGFFTDFGVTATIGAASVRGIFDAHSAEMFGIGGSNPTFTCAAADVVGITEGQAVNINAVAYTVTAVKPDGTGVSVLHLDKA
jgi:hypothetical protein